MSEMSHEARTVPKAHQSLLDDSLIERSPSESRFENIFPFNQDLELWEQYIKFFGGLRLGKLLEDLDFTAGRVAYTHTQGWDRGLGIVTAACDRIDMIGDLPSVVDLKLLACVNWVGRSSLGVGILISSGSPAEWHRVARAYFIMVSRRDKKADL